MDWVTVTEDDRRMLKGIVALLLSFACLAERLSAAPGSLRGLVLAALTRAETIAREFVVAMARDHDVAAQLPAPHATAALCRGDSRADAMRLAQSFRALAALLARLANRNSGDRLRLGRLAANAAGRLMAAVDLIGAVSPLLGATTELGLPSARFAVERIDSS